MFCCFGYIGFERLARDYCHVSRFDVQQTRKMLFSTGFGWRVDGRFLALKGLSHDSAGCAFLFNYKWNGIKAPGMFPQPIPTRLLSGFDSLTST